MFLQPGKHVPDRAFAACEAIPDVKRIAVGKCANEGDYVGVGGEFAFVQSQVADRGTVCGDNVLNLRCLTGLD